MIRIEGLSVPVSDVRSWEEIAAERLSIRRESVRCAELVRRAVDARRRRREINTMMSTTISIKTIMPSMPLPSLLPGSLRFSLTGSAPVRVGVNGPSPAALLVASIILP